jgi:formate dehydrogenase assembly factor FdhD
MLPRYRIPVIEKKANSRKKTHEQYVEELKIKNPTVEVIGQYININTNIEHHCLKHNVCWYTAPSRVLKGAGCKLCKTEKYKLQKTKSHEDYVNEVKSIHSDNIEVLGKYIDAKTPILHKCLIHEIEWNSAPTNVLKGNSCQKCGHEKIGNKLRKSNENYIHELKQINPNISPLENYIQANQAILHKCIIDDYEWKVMPSTLLSGGGCPKCANNLKKTTEEYIAEVNAVNPNIEVIDEYININTKILHRCKKHDIQWKVVPNSILKGFGCYKCGKEKLSSLLSLSHEEYVKKLKEKNPNIIVLGTYINNRTPIMHKCLIDDCEWMSRPGNILSGCGCPKCNKSKGESNIEFWLQLNKINYVPQKIFNDCRDIKPLPFDFYLSDYNACIEYDGEQHFRPIEFFGGKEGFEKRQYHDNIKNEYCKNNGISLLRIPYNKNIGEELNNFLFI